MIWFQSKWRIPLHHNHLQHFRFAGSVRIVFVLFRHKGSAYSVRTCAQILHRQVRDFPLVLARYLCKYHPKNSKPLSLSLSGVGLAVLEKADVISPIIDGETRTSAGTVSAGYQNFLICIEMFCAAIALRYAFPYKVYAQGCVTDSRGRTVTMQSISSSLKVIAFKFFLKRCIIRSDDFRRPWIQRTLWRMPFIISIHSISSTHSTVQVKKTYIFELHGCVTFYDVLLVCS